MAGTELVDIVDSENTVIGSADVDTAHDQRLMHRVVGVFVFDKERKNLYLQNGNKFGKLDLSVGGHVQKGESYDDAVVREMYEELGLRTSLRHVSTFLPAEARLNHYWALYEAVAPNDWIFEGTEEVTSLEKMTVADVLEEIKTRPERFTHGFLNTIGEMIRINAL